jgi:large subunit ribosomal protein L30
MKKQKTKKVNKEKTITVRWKRSALGRPEYQRQTIQGLGFKRLNQIVVVPDRPAIRGMINRVIHLLEVME